MTGIYASVHTVLNSDIVEFEESDLPDSVVFNKRAWNSLPLELAIYFSALDKLIIEDEFYIALGAAATQRLADTGFGRVGKLIAAASQDVAERASLNARQVAHLDRVVEGLGLAFGSDTSRWQEYRDMVAENFRLRVPYGMRLPSGTRSPLDT